MSVEENVRIVNERIGDIAIKANRDPKDITLVAVSKNIPYNKIIEAQKAGVNQFGESRVQEFLGKYELAGENLDWHLIGSLQTNKVKYIIDRVDLIHSLDRSSLAKELNKRAKKDKKEVQALVQVNMSREITKSGLMEEELYPFLMDMAKYPYISVKGLMTIGPLTEDRDAIRDCFRRFRAIFEELKLKNLSHIDMRYLSMGMSGDYDIAIEEGSNMVRLGRAIFGD